MKGVLRDLVRGDARAVAGCWACGAPEQPEAWRMALGESFLRKTN